MGIHPVVGVPDRLELPKRLYDLVPVHLREQLRARLAVAVLAGERAAVGDDEVCGLVEKAPPLPHAASRAQVEVDAAVHAALTEVAVEGGAVSVGVEQLLEVPEVLALTARRDGCVLPARPVVARTACVGGRTEAAGAQRPDSPLAGAIGDERDRRGVGLLFEALDASPRPFAGFRGRLAAELGDQPSTAGGKTRLHPARETIVERFERGRLELHQLGDVVAGLEDVGVAQHDQAARRRAVDEPQRRFQDRHAGSLGADQRPRDVEAVLGQELVEVVARDAPRNVGEALTDLVRIAVAQPAQARVDLAAPPALGDDPLELAGARLGDPHPLAVVREYLERRACSRKCGRPSPNERRTSCCRACRRSSRTRAWRCRARTSGRAPRWRL